LKAVGIAVFDERCHGNGCRDLGVCDDGELDAAVMDVAQWDGLVRGLSSASTDSYGAVHTTSSGVQIFFPLHTFVNKMYGTGKSLGDEKAFSRIACKIFHTQNVREGTNLWATNSSKTKMIEDQV
jgi:hypothetical protein